MNLECSGEALLDKGMTLDCVSGAICNFQPPQVHWFYFVILGWLGVGFFGFLFCFALFYCLFLLVGVGFC